MTGPKDSASTAHFYIPNALDLQSQGVLNQRSGHRVEPQAEFNSGPGILTRDLIEDVETRINRFSSSAPKMIGEAGEKSL